MSSTKRTDIPASEDKKEHKEDKERQCAAKEEEKSSKIDESKHCKQTPTERDLKSPPDAITEQKIKEPQEEEKDFDERLFERLQEIKQHRDDFTAIVTLGEEYFCRNYSYRVPNSFLSDSLTDNELLEMAIEYEDGDLTDPRNDHILAHRRKTERKVARTLLKCEYLVDELEFMPTEKLTAILIWMFVLKRRRRVYRSDSVEREEDEEEEDPLSIHRSEKEKI